MRKHKSFPVFVALILIVLSWFGWMFLTPPDYPSSGDSIIVMPDE